MKKKIILICTLFLMCVFVFSPAKEELCMASSKDYLQYVLEQCPGDVSSRDMMGEFILYYRDKVFGGIFDDRFLVKPTKAAISLMPEAPLEIPYEGAKKMLLVERVDDRQFLQALLQAMEPELPEKKKRSQKK